MCSPNIGDSLKIIHWVSKDDRSLECSYAVQWGESNVNNRKAIASEWIILPPWLRTWTPSLRQNESKTWLHVGSMVTICHKSKGTERMPGKDTYTTLPPPLLGVETPVCVLLASLSRYQNTENPSCFCKGFALSVAQKLLNSPMLKPLSWPRSPSLFS